MIRGSSQTTFWAPLPWLELSAHDAFLPRCWGLDAGVRLQHIRDDDPDWPTPIGAPITDYWYLEAEVRLGPFLGTLGLTVYLAGAPDGEEREWQER